MSSLAQANGSATTAPRRCSTPISSFTATATGAGPRSAARKMFDKARYAFPKIVMTILVKDEADIIQENIEYHLSRGVDHFIVMDNDSKDGTTEILKRYEREGVLDYIYQDGVYSQSEWVTQMARLAYQNHKADWVINNDADEFWWHDCGCLKTALCDIPKEVGVVRARRHNMLREEGLESEKFYDRMTFRRKRSLNPVGKPLLPKVCARGSDKVVVHSGSHNITLSDQDDVIDSDIEIFHFPFRYEGQVRRKIDNIGAGYEKNPQGNAETGAAPGRAMRAIYSSIKDDPSAFNRFYETCFVQPNVSAIDSHDLVEDLRLKKALRVIMARSISK